MERGNTNFSPSLINFPPSMEGKKYGLEEEDVREKEENESQGKTEIVYAFSGGVAPCSPKNPLFSPYNFLFSKYA